VTGGGWRRSLLFTDLYQLVMAQLYVAEGIADRPAQFDYVYRSNPDYGRHQAGFGVFAGLGPLLEWMASTSITGEDLDVLASQLDPDGHRRFDDGFLGWLDEHGHFGSLEVRAVGEGRVVHPDVPLVTVTGPLAVAQLLETALLNLCNYPTLVATKATRVVASAHGADVLEFGMRRGPGAGVDEAARAALIGGCSATSNVQASAALGTSPSGTHAHSMVQAYLADGGSELDAFRAFARRYPRECTLLVDTVDTLRSGVPNAIRVFEELRAQGHRPRGIRLDSGDLAHLAVRSARMLDDAGFPEVRIVLSGDLDELTIWQIRAQVAEESTPAGLDPAAVLSRLVYGVGTRLITSEGQPALGGVYKLTALQDGDRRWRPAIKLSESADKIPIAGPKTCWRLYDQRGLATADLMTLPDEVPFDDGCPTVLHHPTRADVRRELRADEVSGVEPLHDVVFADGRRTQPVADLEELRRRRGDDVGRLDTGVRRLVNPHRYHVSLSEALHRHQRDTIERLRAGRPS
jgi:nicotinate phosphoribosyltransferase